MEITRKTFDLRLSTDPRYERWAIAKAESKEDKAWLKSNQFVYNPRNGKYERQLWQKPAAPLFSNQLDQLE